MHIGGMVEKFEIISARERKEVAEKLNDYLSQNPTNVQALMLYVHIGIDLGDDDFTKLHEALNKALEKEPRNAEVHYWKARLYGEKMVNSVDSAESAESAIKFAKKAVELNPDNDLFRETLVLYLAEKRKFEEARVFIKNTRGGKHPVYLLLRDLQYFPLHINTIFLPGETENLVKAVKDKGEITDYHSLRVHVFSVPLSAEGLEDFFEKFLPEFNLFEITRDKKKRTTD